MSDDENSLRFSCFPKFPKKSALNNINLTAFTKTIISLFEKRALIYLSDITDHLGSSVPKPANVGCFLHKKRARSPQSMVAVDAKRPFLGHQESLQKALQ